jgi:drug/metabolite transporter (DMT)-like permease
MTTEHRPMNALEWGILLILAGVWGGSFFFNAIAVRDLPPMTFVWLRVAIAAAALFVAIKARGVPLPQGRAAWTVAFGMGMLNCAVPFSLIVWGQTRIDSGVAAILNATTPLFTVLVAHAFTRDERLTLNKVLGVLAGIAGVAVMIGPEALGGLTEQVPAQLAVVAAAVCYGFAAVLGRSYARLGVRPMAAGFSQLLCATVVMAPLALVADRPWTLAPPGLAAWGAVLAIALVSTAMAYALLFRLLATAGATNTSLVTLLVPVSAVLLGVLFLGERLGLSAGAGMALIALGLALSDGRLAAALTGRARRLPAAGPPPLPGDRPPAA